MNDNNNIEIGDLVTYLPDDESAWDGKVIDIKNDDTTKRHGHSGDVYIVKDLRTTAVIATNFNNLKKKNEIN
jgi:hypothetical protein